MPIPNKKSGEKENDFISRCMSDNTMVKEFKDEKQRYAICKLKWDKK